MKTPFVSALFPPCPNIPFRSLAGDDLKMKSEPEIVYLAARRLGLKPIKH